MNTATFYLVIPINSPKLENDGGLRQDESETDSSLSAGRDGLKSCEPKYDAMLRQAGAEFQWRLSLLS